MTEVSDLTPTSSIFVNLIDENEGTRGDPLELPLCTTSNELQLLCNHLDKNDQDDETLEN